MYVIGNVHGKIEATNECVEVLNIGIIIVSPIPCFVPLYTTIAFNFYIPLTFSTRMFLYLVYK